MYDDSNVVNIKDVASYDVKIDDIASDNVIIIDDDESHSLETFTDSFDSEGSLLDLVESLILVAIIASPLVVGYGVYKAVKFVLGNKKMYCERCKKEYRKKELSKLDLTEFRVYTDNEGLDGFLGESYYKAVNKSNWLYKDIDGKQMCSDCSEKAKKKLCKQKITIQEELLIAKEKMHVVEEEAREKLKKVCPKCRKKFMPKELSLVDYNVLPEWWDWKQYSNVELCSICKKDIEIMEAENYNQIYKIIYPEDYYKRKVNFYPESYSGNIKIDKNSVQIDIASAFYEYNRDAKKELIVRAYYEGFDVIYNARLCSEQFYEGNYISTQKRWIGDFAKKQNP